MQKMYRYKTYTKNHSAPIKLIIILCTALILGFLLISCGLIPIPPIPETGNGEMLVQHGKYLYRIGGFDSDGNVQSTIYMTYATIHTDDTITVESWTPALPLPEGRAFGAAFSAGQYLYVIGGENNSGPVDTIYMAKIDPDDGSLGYYHTYYSEGEILEGPSYWVDHSTPLPQPRSHMGWTVYDGRVFLIGGNGSAAGSAGELDTIIHSRIRVVSSGKTGIWYSSPVTLPEPRTDISAGVLNGRLYILGGKTANSLKDYVDSYALNPYGLLTNHRKESKLPAPRGRLQVIPNGDQLITGSGYNFEGELSESYWVLGATGWNRLEKKAAANALSHGRIAGNILVMGTENSLSILDLDLAPMTPEILPGSGYIRKKGTDASLWSEPGNTVMFLKNIAGIPEDEDWEMMDSAGFALETEYASTYTFQAFSETESSPAVTRNYYPLLLPSFYLETILINNTGTASYKTLSFTDTLLDGTVYQLEEALYRIPVYRTFNVIIDWQDITSDSTYTSQADFTLLEADYFTEVLDNNGVPVASKPALFSTRSETGYGNQVSVTLHPGTYYLHITDTDESSGGTVGFFLSADTDGL